MTTLFADAGYWIVLWNPRDALHQKAMTIADGLGASAVVTTQLVLTEAIAYDRDFEQAGFVAPLRGSQE